MKTAFAEAKSTNAVIPAKAGIQIKDLRIPIALRRFEILTLRVFGFPPTRE
jgi:hypothetical protein